MADDTPFAFSALPNTAQELESAAHRDELPDTGRTVLTIMEPEPAENPGEAPGWWLDFGNGTYLAVYGHDDLATVYTGDALDPAAMTEQLTGIYLDLDATLAGALENPTETWE